MMKNVTRFEMVVHTNDDIYTGISLGQNENRSYEEFFFIFHVSLEKFISRTPIAIK